jgi:phosphatidylinositol glycan class B
MINIPKNWLIFALLIHIIAAWYSVGHYHDDEYHQILAFTSSKIGLADSTELRWEYQDELRSGFQPFFAYTIVKPLSYLGIDSTFIHAFILRLISSLISIAALIYFIQAISPEIRDARIRKIGVYYLLFLWLQVFVNVRFSSEGWAESLFILGFSIYLINTRRTNNLNLLIGFIFGLAFLSRYQTGLMLAGFGLWMICIRREKLEPLFTIIAGGIIALAFGVYCDYWLYNKFVLTTWNYLSVNLLEGRVEAFTHEPWWYYIYYSSVQILPPITLLLPAIVISFWIIFRKHPITWITIPFILFHNYIGHKEMRFLFPVLGFAPIMFALVSDKIITLDLLKRNLSIIKFIKFIFFTSLIINTVLLILVMFLPASKEVVMWEKCLSHITEPSNSVIILTPDIGELSLNFYNTQKIELASTETTNSIGDLITENKQKTVYFAARKMKHLDKLEKEGISSNLECQIVPNWLMSLNINNWTSRASLWRLWKIKDKNP